MAKGKWQMAKVEQEGEYANMRMGE